MKINRNYVIIAVLAGVVVLIALGFRPKAVPVETELIVSAPLRVMVSEEGKTRVIDRYVVSAPVTGYARRLKLHAGDSIKKGDTLAVIEPQRSRVLDARSRAEAKARVQAAKSALLAAKENREAAMAEYEFAEGEYERKRELFAEGFITKSEIELAEAAVKRTKAAKKSADFSVEVSGFDLEAAETALEYTGDNKANGKVEAVMIKAPVGGGVLKVYRESEGTVTEGTPLLEIGELSELEVVVEVLSEDSIKISPGTRVYFDRWGGGTVLEGIVRVVEPSGFTKVSALGVEEQRVRVVSDISTPIEERLTLGDGYRVEANFLIWEAPDVVVVPNSALFRKGDKWAVFLFADGVARVREVELGERGARYSELRGGLAKGEVVIIHPDDSIEDNKKVTLR